MPKVLLGSKQQGTTAYLTAVVDGNWIRKNRRETGITIQFLATAVHLHYPQEAYPHVADILLRRRAGCLNPDALVPKMRKAIQSQLNSEFGSWEGRKLWNNPTIRAYLNRQGPDFERNVIAHMASLPLKKKRLFKRATTT